jgi:hypothetical protein
VEITQWLEHLFPGGAAKVDRFAELDRFVSVLFRRPASCVAVVWQRRH